MPRQPRSTSGELSTQLVKIYLTPSEKQKAQTLAGTLTLSEHFRQSGLSQRQVPPVPEVNRLLYLEMGRIGQSLQQIAQACHRVARQGDRIFWREQWYLDLLNLLRQRQWQLLNPSVSINSETPVESSDSLSVHEL